MERNFKYLLIAFVLILLAQTVAFACKCSGEADFDKMFNESDAVIKGEVIIVENFNLEIFALIKVEKSWKGIQEDKVIIKTDTGSCGVVFEVGETYYLWVDKLDKNYVTMPCRNYGEKQIAFLEDKPILILKSSNPDFEKSSNSTESSSKQEKEDMEESNDIRQTEKSKIKSTDLALTFAVSVTATVLIVLGLIVGFFFWRNRNK